MSDKKPTPDEPQRQSIPEINMPDWLSASVDTPMDKAPDVEVPVQDEPELPGVVESAPMPADGLQEAIPGWMQEPAVRQPQNPLEAPSLEIDLGALIDESDLPTWIRRLTNDQIPPDAGEPQDDVATVDSHEAGNVVAAQMDHGNEPEQAASSRFVEYTKTERSDGDDVVQNRTILAFGLVVLVLLIIALAVYL